MNAVIISFFVSLFFLHVVFAQETARERVMEQWETDTSIRSVPLNEFKVLLPRDRIPPIDNPVYWSKKQADTVFFEHEPVLAIERTGDARAYPLSVLMWHEIVNDVVGDVPVSITYCPLCNAAIVFGRQLHFEGNEYLLDFGTTGMLRKSDLVMWDRQTETWWQQLTGEALVGGLTGATLTMIPSVLISYAEFFESYPDGKVLSRKTGHKREYGRNPYIGYDNPSNTKPSLFTDEVDDRLPAMERGINISVGNKHRVYPLSVIQKEKVINDEPFGKPVVVFHQSGTVSVTDREYITRSREVGTVSVFDPVLDGQRLTFIKSDSGFMDIETNSRWTIVGKAIEGSLKGKQLPWILHGNHFAFAWLAFHPESEIYGQ
jgi:hypothetical protein